MSFGASKAGWMVSREGLAGKLGWFVKSETDVPGMLKYTSRNAPLVSCPWRTGWMMPKMATPKASAARPSPRIQQCVIERNGTPGLNRRIRAEFKTSLLADCRLRIADGGLRIAD